MNGILFIVLNYREFSYGININKGFSFGDREKNWMIIVKIN